VRRHGLANRMLFKNRARSVVPVAFFLFHRGRGPYARAMNDSSLLRVLCSALNCSLLLVLCSCPPGGDPAIIGKWKAKDSDHIVEICKNGTWVEPSYKDADIISCKWEWDGTNRIRVTAES